MQPATGTHYGSEGGEELGGHDVLEPGLHPAPQKLSPMAVRSGCGATVFAAPGGDLFVFDSVKMALFQVGSLNKVLFPVF